MRNSVLTLWIIVALIAGIVVGMAAPDFAVKLHPLMTIFLRMVKMIIAPLLFATLVVGIAGHGDPKKLGRVGIKTIVYFEVVTTIALLIGLGVAHITNPGLGIKGADKLPLDELIQQSSQVGHHTLGELLINTIPESIIHALAENQLLQIVIFSIFFALAICTVGKKAKPVMDLLNSVCQIMFKFTEFVMIFAPFGIFGAMAYAIGENGISILKNYAKVIFSLYGALFIFVSIVLFIACKIVKISLRAIIRAIEEPALLAFSTASSEAALPKAMEIMEKFGVPKSIVGFVMPTGYTFNLDGSTLYLAIAVIFCAQVVPMQLPLEQQLLIMFCLMFTSKGLAGVPRVAPIVLVGILPSFHIPIYGVAILLGIDALLDMGRTTVNLIGNCVATVVIARWENEFDYNKMNEYIASTAEKLESKPYTDDMDNA